MLSRRNQPLDKSDNAARVSDMMTNTCPTCKGHGFIGCGPYRDPRPCTKGCTPPTLPATTHAEFMAAWRTARQARKAARA